jgi:hypothetical protein
VPITELMLIGYCAMFVLLPAGLELLARARGFPRLAVLGLVAGEVVGILVFGAALLALAYNWSTQDAGEEPARTLRTAIPLLAAGGLGSLIPWLIVVRRRAR